MFADRNYGPSRDSRTAEYEAVQSLWVIIAINVGCYLLGLADRYPLLMLFPNPVNFRWFQVISYMFFHADFWHLLFNMYGLYIFGRLVAPILGRRDFLGMYFVSGLAGAGLWLWANWGSRAPALGASGALFGVMMAVAMLKPNTEFYMMFIPVPVKAKTLIVVYALIEIFSQWKLSTNIAHLAHLGGFVGAYLYLMIFCRREVIWSIGDIFRSKGPRFYRNPQTQAASSSNADGETEKITKVSQREIDRLLDKISREGINSLSDHERAELQFFREQMLKNSGR